MLLYTKTVLFWVVCVFLFSSTLPANHPGRQNPHHPREIVFPDIPGYVTLSTDLHIHTVFSDGRVWPTIRVGEALRDQLDAIAITDHLEHQPFKDDIPNPDRNRAYEVALKSARNSDLMVINGSEITRSMPPGHANAIFLEDANKLLVDEPIDAYREAQRQNAFIFWNHPSWHRQSEDGIARLHDLHLDLLEEGLLHGIEVVTKHRYSKEAIQIALDYDLAMLGTSDVHGLVDWDFEVHEGGHRPVTLVFAEERSPESLKAALMAGRTVVWQNHLLIGRDEYMTPLIEESLSITNSSYMGNSSVLNVDIYNHTGHQFILKNTGEFSFHNHSNVVTLTPYENTTISVNLPERLSTFQLPFEVLNAVIGPDDHPEMILNVKN